ncbi:MAG TPA: DUF418 domain-containing protein, partial [Myxococcaceae bacterium]|nr:DUF418 domain-containing protein [Myxococcaceae bacterium]
MTDNPSKPVEAHERLPVLDVLRGFALGGVFVANAAVFFSGQVFLGKEQVAERMASPVDAVASRVFEFLVAGKAMAIFSFLFGVGFGIQLLRAEERGASMVPLYVRRLGILLLLGLTHLFALWFGDILVVYALVGFGLLLLRERSEKSMLALALVLILAVPLLVFALAYFLPRWVYSPEVAEAAMKASQERIVAIKARTLEAFAGGSYLDVVKANADYYFKAFLKPVMVGWVSVTLGRFLLGLLAARRGLFHDVSRHRGFFRRLLGWGLVAGVVGNGAMVLVRYLMGQELLPERSGWYVLLTLARELGHGGLAAFYVAAIALLLQRPLGRRLLSVLAPAGRMALTNYLTQTVVGVSLFYGYGLGLIGRLGPARCLALITGLFCVQVLLSHLWLAYFRYGPAEWLWRSLTYGKPQPLRAKPLAADDRA